jgi:hypothetical protein
LVVTGETPRSFFLSRAEKAHVPRKTMARGCATPEALLSNTLAKGLQPDFRSLDPAGNKLKTAIVGHGRSTRREGRTIVERFGMNGRMATTVIRLFNPWLI